MKALGKVVSREFPFLPDNTPRDLEIRAGLHLLRRARCHVMGLINGEGVMDEHEAACRLIELRMKPLYDELEAIAGEADA